MHGFRTVRRLADDVQPSVAVEQRNDALPEQSVVVGHDDPHAAHSGTVSCGISTHPPRFGAGFESLSTMRSPKRVCDVFEPRC